MISKAWLVAKYKAVDLDIHIITPSRTEPTHLTLGAELAVGYNCDHAGFSLSIGLIFVYFSLVYYDTRHRESR